MILTDIFESRRGNDLDRKYLSDARRSDGVNYVSRAARNNGVTGRVQVPEGVEPFDAGCLTVALGSRNYVLV